MKQRYLLAKQKIQKYVKYNGNFILNTKIWYAILLITIFFAFCFRGFIAYSDSSSTWFSPFYNAKLLFFSWSDYPGLGIYQPNNFTSFFLRLFYSLFALVNNKPEFIQKTVWISFFSITGIVLMAMIHTILKKRFYAFISVLFLYFNPISQLYLWTQQQWTYYLIFPYFIGIFLYLKFCETQRLYYALIIPIIWFFFGFALNQPAYFAPFLLIVLSIFIYMLFSIKNKYRFLLKNILLAVLFLLVNFVYLLPIAIGGNAILDKTQAAYGGSSMPILNDLKDINFFYSFINITKGYNIFYTTNSILISLWVGFFLLIFYYAFNPERRLQSGNARKYLILFSGILLIFIFLTKGISPPFSEFSNFIYSFKIMYIFRGFKEKFAIGYSIAIAFLFIYLFLQKNTKVKLYLVLIGLLSYLAFVSNYWYPNNLKYSDNLTYLTNIHFPTNNITRILNLPLGEYSFFYAKNPDYVGDNPMKNIFKKDVIYSSFQGVGDKKTQAIKNAFSAKKLPETDFYQYLQDYNIEYILDNKNSYVPQNKTKTPFDYTMLGKYPFLQKVSQGKTYIIYQFRDFTPRIFSTNLSFQQISPIQYKLYIKNIKKSQPLIFLDSFDPGWKLYLQQSPSNSWCHSQTEYRSILTTECIPAAMTNIFPPDTYPILDNTHHVIKDYANAWDIDPALVKKNYPASFYTVNSDGSINIELTMYFYPQVYFYIGLAVSILFVLGSAICVIYLTKKKSYERS